MPEGSHKGHSYNTLSDGFTITYKHYGYTSYCVTKLSYSKSKTNQETWSVKQQITLETVKTVTFWIEFASSTITLKQFPQTLAISIHSGTFFWCHRNATWLQRWQNVTVNTKTTGWNKCSQPSSWSYDIWLIPVSATWGANEKTKHSQTSQNTRTNKRTVPTTIKR
jgi:hypothetical protein